MLLINIFADNYIMTYNLLKVLTERKVNCAGTARIKWFASPPLPSDVNMKKSRRGTSSAVMKEEKTIDVIKWMDRKGVFSVLNFMLEGPLHHVKRCEKINNKWEKVDISQSEIVKVYNQHKVGVNVFDQYMEQLQNKV